MKKRLPINYFFISVLFFANPAFSQLPTLKTAANYVLFTKTGAVSNTGISQITGAIGTDNGLISGFELPTVILGVTDSGNVATVQAALDVQSAYDQLFNTEPTSTSHAPAFGSGEVLVAGVYSISAAGSVAGDLTLDAQGNTNAVFIFKFGGALTTGASTTVKLINGASSCNIFWTAEGAISMAASTSMKGTMISNNGAISLGAGGDIEGRMLSTTGAASIYQSVVMMPACDLIILPVAWLSFAGSCKASGLELTWSTASEVNSKYFAVEKSSTGNSWEELGRTDAAGNSSAIKLYSMPGINPANTDGLYRIRQVDMDDVVKYSRVITLKKCEVKTNLSATIFPNPSNGVFDLLVKGNNGGAYTTEVTDAAGRMISTSFGSKTHFDLSQQPTGSYYLIMKTFEKTFVMKVSVIH